MADVIAFKNKGKLNSGLTANLFSKKNYPRGWCLACWDFNCTFWMCV